jgi:hypothetical protein
MAGAQNPSPRLPLQMHIEFRKSYARQGGKGTLKNISLSGAFLETDTVELFPSDKLIVTINLSERTRRMTATVVWKNGRGCGLQFHPFNKRDVQIVDDLMYFVQNTRSGHRSILDGIIQQVSRAEDQ